MIPRPERDAALGGDQHEAAVLARVPDGPRHDDQRAREREQHDAAPLALPGQPERGERKEEEHRRPRQDGESGQRAGGQVQAAAPPIQREDGDAGEGQHAEERLAPDVCRRPYQRRVDGGQPASGPGGLRAGRPARPARPRARQAPRQATAWTMRIARSSGTSAAGGAPVTRMTAARNTGYTGARPKCSPGAGVPSGWRCTNPRPSATFRASSRYSRSSWVSGLSTQYPSANARRAAIPTATASHTARGTRVFTDPIPIPGPRTAGRRSAPTRGRPGTRSPPA